MKLIKQGLWKEYSANKQRLLHGKFSNFKSTSQNIGDYEDLEYFINITIGTPDQVFSVIFDTETSMFMIPDKKCSSCQDVVKFDSSKSSTYQSTNYTLFGSSDYGVYGKDFVRFGNPGMDQLVIPNTLFGQLYKEMIAGADGIMGLGIATGNPEEIDSPITNAINSGILDNPVVTIFLNGQGPISGSNNGGVITFGAVDTVNCDHNVIYESLSNPNYFEVSLKAASLGSNQFTGGWGAVVDTGTAFIAAPPEITVAFANEINATYDDNSGVYTVDCNVKFNMNLTIGSTVYTLTEKTMVLNYDESNCLFALFPIASETWIFGYPWFRTVCNVLDYGNKRVGFANIISS